MSDTIYYIDIIYTTQTYAFEVPFTSAVSITVKLFTNILISFKAICCYLFLRTSPLVCFTKPSLHRKIVIVLLVFIRRLDCGLMVCDIVVLHVVTTLEMEAMHSFETLHCCTLGNSCTNIT